MPTVVRGVCGALCSKHWRPSRPPTTSVGGIMLPRLFKSTLITSSRIRSVTPPRPYTLRLVQQLRMVTTTTLPRKPIFGEIAKHDPKSIAIVQSESGKTYSYGDLLKDVAASKQSMLDAAQVKSLDGERVAFLVENGYDYVVTFLAILANQAIALPLSPAFPNHELEYILNDSAAKLVLASEKHEGKAQELLKGNIEAAPIYTQIHKILDVKSTEDVEFQDMPEDVGGMMLYTSGTTAKPKGVIIPTSALRAQCQSLATAWKYSPSDRLLHVLPLHHIHGCMNALLTPLYSGSSIEFMYPFKPETAWARLAAPFKQGNDSSKEKITFLTVVPAIYTRFLDSYATLSPEDQEAASKGISPENMRLNISGSAALPTPTKQAWTKISHGNVILERFGMTEIGMGISCGLDYADRVDGSVGWALPLVEARLVDSDTNELIKEGEETDANGKERSGEIQIRGPTVFKEYWRKPEATAAEFVKSDDGKGNWFKTGDIAVRKVVEGAGKSDQEWAKGPMFFIHGRKSADIIKTGGEKVSALEIEREMLSLPQVKEVAVVGVTSEKWGQKVCAVVVLTAEGKTAGKDGKPWSPLDMRKAMKERLVPYKIPQVMVTVDEIPRNAMGKINKKSLVAEVWPRGASPPPESRVPAA